MMAMLVPLAIVIEDNVLHGRIFQDYLSNAGFEVVLCTNILDAEASIRTWFSTSTKFRPGAVIIDAELPLHGHKSVEGSTLALLVQEEILAGVLHPVHLVAISGDMTPVRRQLADQAGCSVVWQKPIRHQMIQELCSIIYEQPERAKVPNPAIQALAQNSLDLLRSLVKPSAWSSREWCPHEVRLVLGYISESIRLNTNERNQAEQLIEELGGLPKATQLLRASHSVLADDHYEIIKCFLRKDQQKQIQERLGIGRTRFENDVAAIYELVAVSWSSAQLINDIF
jgi:CheY-like chemotaxis protein